ncbi:hypothetical protein FKM82_014412 [Ascaphus truei]
MNKIIVFQKTNFQGIQKEFTATQQDLLKWNFNKCICSVKVIGQPWLLYQQPNCVGDYCVYEEGDHPNIDWAMNIQSIDLITDDLSEPQMTLYYGKDSKDFTRESNLTYGQWNDKSDYCQVQKGAWVLYADVDLVKSDYTVVRPAQKKLDLSRDGFNQVVSYARPLRPGTAKVTTNVLWDEMIKGDAVVDQVKSLSGTNASNEETEFVVTSSKSVETSMTYSFNYSQSTTVEVGVSGNIPLIGEVSSSISSSFNFEMGNSKSTTVTAEVEVEVPAVIPPKSRLLVHVMQKKYDVRVPVQIIVERNNAKKILMGELSCKSGRTIYAEYQTEPI